MQPEKNNAGSESQERCSADAKSVEFSVRSAPTNGDHKPVWQLYLGPIKHIDLSVSVWGRWDPTQVELPFRLLRC